MNDLPTSPSLPDAVQQLAASVVGLSHRGRRSSAVLWRDGVAVGSASALWGAGEVSVVRPGEVRGIDGATDLAAIAFDAAGLPVAARAVDAAPRVGEFVCAVGRDPSGLTHASFGHVGAAAGAWQTWRGGRIDRLIRLDGALYPGLNGAPVADASARVLGIASNAFSRHHAVVVPVATVERVLDALLTHGRVAQGHLGIAVQPVRAVLDGAATDGVLVSSVAPEGPAAQAGVLVGDVIVGAGGASVASLNDLRAVLQVGAQIDVQVSRAGRAVTLSVAVTDRPASRDH